MGRSKSTCHPDRDNHGKGMCSACILYKRKNPDWEVGTPRKEKWKAGSPLLCGHDRAHNAKGLCKSCYEKQDYRRSKIALASKRYTATGRRRAGKYKLTTDQLFAILVGQNFQCPICSVTITFHYNSDNTFQHSGVVDHDHSCCSTKSKSCGKCVRSILCNNCNAMIGFANEDEAILSSAIEYVKKWRNS